jgi:hypothetical protein
LIFAGIYYALLPVISTYTSEKVDKLVKKCESGVACHGFWF